MTISGPTRHRSPGALGEAASRLPRATAGVLVLAALVSGIALLPGTRFAATTAERTAWIVEHRALWNTGWGIVFLAMVLLGAFLSWWTLRIRPTPWTPWLVGMAAAAVLLDGWGILLFIREAPRGSEAANRMAALLTAGAATALYSLAGSLLTWKTPGLARRRPLLFGACWLGAFGLSVSTLLEFHAGIYASVAANWSLLPWVCLATGSHLAPGHPARD